ncbi:hypothetical protein OIU79_004928 [Salix purpurea]|uniref:Uncharacterized protein n=1 Tax=Salix purpurea TaxID=77065 RepID=A0A9Q0UBB0_SALPP|nr:hypothetical protein OIU79_004928 [Salix purpurea]
MVCDLFMDVSEEVARLNRHIPQNSNLILIKMDCTNFPDNVSRCEHYCADQNK